MPCHRGLKARSVFCMLCENDFICERIKWEKKQGRDSGPGVDGQSGECARKKSNGWQKESERGKWANICCVWMWESEWVSVRAPHMKSRWSFHINCITFVMEPHFRKSECTMKFMFPKMTVCDLFSHRACGNRKRGERANEIDGNGITKRYEIDVSWMS